MSQLHIRVLGAAAGGGFPQWNCNYPTSRRARAGDAAARPRTQSSIAVSADNERWTLFNASPDLRQQINDNPPLQPRGEQLRHSPIEAVALTNGDVDHVAGLLNLRESQPLMLYATAKILAVLAANPIFQVLNPHYVHRHPLQLEEAIPLRGPEGDPLGFKLRPFAVPGKVALWLEDEAIKHDPAAHTRAVGEDTVALEVLDDQDRSRLFYIPGCATIDSTLRERLRRAELVLFDGTLWQDDEMIRAGVGVKSGQRMGHMSISGEAGSLAAFADLGVKRKIYIHLNTTNPVLLDDSPERAEVVTAGWEVAYDGMALTL